MRNQLITLNDDYTVIIRSDAIIGIFKHSEEVHRLTLLVNNGERYGLRYGDRKEDRDKDYDYLLSVLTEQAKIGNLGDKTGQPFSSPKAG